MTGIGAPPLPSVAVRPTPRALLLVEDNPADAHLVRELLDDTGRGLFDRYQIVHVSDMGQAVERLRLELPDVILLDLGLPDMSGTATVQEVRRVAGSVPIVVLTGIDDEDLAWQCVDLGARDFICKSELKSRVLRRAIGHAITLRREEQLRQAQKMEAVGQLTGGIAHDFNNLLSIIVGSLQMLGRRTTDNAASSHLIAMAERAAFQGADLTRRLLAFSRRQPLDPKVIDVNERLDNMVRLFRRTLGEQIEFVTRPEPEAWLIKVDPSQFEAALLNLSINARDAMPNGGRLTIETANTELDHRYVTKHPYVSEGPYLLVAVSDTGTGIRPENLERVFEPFFTTKEAGKGSGLGLSMVYGFVKQSGGCVNIYSEPGRGTIVKLYFPRSAAGPADDAPECEGSDSTPGGDEKILLVEDNPDVRVTVHMQLAELGYCVIEAENAAMALRLMGEHDDIDLLLTDVVMPGGTDGVDLALEAQKTRPGVRVVFTSGYTRAGVERDGEKIPGAVLLSKPYSSERLARTVRDVLDGE